MQSRAQPFAASTIRSASSVGLRPGVSWGTSITTWCSDASTSSPNSCRSSDDDRERRGELPESAREIVDLGLRRVPAGEHAEVDPHLDAGLVVLARGSEIAGSLANGFMPSPIRRLELLTLRGSHRNFNAATTSPATPQAASTPSAAAASRTRDPCR